MKFVEISWCIVYIQIADWTRFDDPSVCQFIEFRLWGVKMNYIFN